MLRELTVLGEFKPYGLIAEALDSKPEYNNVAADKYDYFLFDPEIVRDQCELNDSDISESPFGDQCDHELFIRGNTIIWSIGSRVFKRFTSPTPVKMACWCRLGDTSEALLCVLQIDSLTVCSISGELVSIPLPCTITSMWPLPFGLLLQSVAEGERGKLSIMKDFDERTI
ncbi:anaphase-promoting complex subunit 1-like [Mercurialis annua]|uniref:anaphase-promoting complex subunit 1-like n=1 Tax=Mercurialis annua TaxID=3986 RepID=UPI00215FC365|nr:anaphase-promoting complex subunit 1-like [Mercurialis annua]XP_050232604.1 anaphase-promoting complex subunit 1-like [Mercurialis annua]XP_050232612.1 anaphase-promoting complex subunit 1-like [Mercurialis annua]